MSKKIIEIYKDGKKQCEIFPDELTEKELKLALEIQIYQGRTIKEEGEK